jgi:hypothetical protein
MKIDLLLDVAALEGGTGRPVRMPALEMLMARGDPLPCPGRSLQECLLELFHVPREAPPIAALTLLGDGGAPGAYYWLRADPVCLQATRTRLVLAPLPEGDVSEEEARELAAALQAHLAASGHELLACRAQRWYIRCEQAPRLHAEPPLTTGGLLTEDQLPSGEDGPFWRRLMTEAQMLLHEHAVNSEREARGKLPVNAIWPWGGGHLPVLARSPYAKVYGDDPLLRGLARCTESESAALPDTIDAVLTHASGARDLLVVPTPHGGSDEPERFDARWIDPLSRALQNGSLEELRILLLDAAGSRCRSLNRAKLRRFWRRARPLFAHA